MSAYACPKILAGLAGLTSAIAWSPAHAAELGGGETITTEAVTSSTDEPSTGWEFSATGYAWFSGLSGDIGVFPALQPIDVDLSFGDVLDHLDFAGMAFLHARKGRFVGLADIEYIDLGATREILIRDREFAEGDLDTSTFTATAAAGYRVVDRGPLFLDLVAGIRITALETRVELRGPARTVADDSSLSWVDPLIGAQFRAPLGEHWAVVLYGDIGGFGVGSDLSWQLLGTVQYQVGRNIWLSGGWRQYAVDYDKDGFVYDVTMGGPIAGVTFDF
jgi:hypothetical protein